uniref:Predicted oxidoreductase n=1 Tax=Candidatus Kentrum eta TaxID=2126337 RepID=A0A450UYZ2_9GAMM|nr:MAG: Predicted oxidoreductase [Candidatus Kentron sp. H]VFJ91211.1 MAG: Predicted oxidoreductase [Candidatus Kentron sp. H]VFJ97749.1 MAG: Predicted oxidoreductase [Candidatus Kentron sp. H]
MAGLAVSRIGLGTVKLGRATGVKYPHAFTIPNHAQALALLSRARELGINLIDTAPAYGASEARLGKLLRGMRNDWVICSKAGEEFDPVSGESTYHFTPKHIRMSVERSLTQLGTDRVDILLIHSDGNDREIIERHGALATLDELKREGKIVASGMSTKTVAGGLLAAQQADCVMVTWNLAYDRDLPVIDYCYAQGKGALIKKALDSGHAPGHATNPSKVDPIRKTFEMILAHPGVSSVIIGTIDTGHLADNVEKAKKSLGT